MFLITSHKLAYKGIEWKGESCSDEGSKNNKAVHYFFGKKVRKGGL